MVTSWVLVLRNWSYTKFGFSQTRSCTACITLTSNSVSPFQPVSPMCSRCGTARRSHLFWHGPVLWHFWCNEFNWFSKQSKINIQHDYNPATSISWKADSYDREGCSQEINRIEVSIIAMFQQTAQWNACSCWDGTDSHQENKKRCAKQVVWFHQ